MAVPTGIEPAISCVTGRHVNRYTTGPQLCICNSRHDVYGFLRNKKTSPATSYSHRGKPPTTIGAEELNFRVRYGNGCDLFASVTRLGLSLFTQNRIRQTLGLFKSVSTTNTSYVVQPQRSDARGHKSFSLSGIAPHVCLPYACRV